MGSGNSPSAISQLPTPMTKIIITGSKGRMGQALVSCSKRYRELEITGQIDQGGDLAAVIDKGDVVVDFSHHDATPAIVELCAKNQKAVVIGTTGHSDSEKSQIVNCKSQIPMVWASNFSTGVNTLFWLTRKAAEILGPDYDLEVIEMHHRMKKDAPSGTAKSLAEILANVRKLDLNEAARHGRAGITGERTTGGNRHSLPSRRRRRWRPHGHFCKQRRAGGTDTQGDEPRHASQRRVARGALGRQAETRPLRHAGRAWVEIILSFYFLTLS